MTGAPAPGWAGREALMWSAMAPNGLAAFQRAAGLQAVVGVVVAFARALCSPGQGAALASPVEAIWASLAVQFRF